MWEPTEPADSPSEQLDPVSADSIPGWKDLPVHERRVLLAEFAGWDLAHRGSKVLLSAKDAKKLAALISQRLAGWPLQYLVGKAFFRLETILVGPGVFIPRPETEVMTGWAIDYLHQRQKAAAVFPAQPVVVELCAGSGAISKAIAREAGGACQYAVELSEEAYVWLQRNLADTQVHTCLGDMAQALPELNAKVDLVIANPPYIPLSDWQYLPDEVKNYDPELALFSGADGLDAIRVLTKVGQRLLRSGGVICVEHAEHQHEDIVHLFTVAGFAEVQDHQDLTNRWRFITARYGG